MEKKVRKYELYTHGPGFPITNLSKNYRSGMWIVEVKAKSIKQAYYLLANGVCKDENSNVGICFVDNSYGPKQGRPWDNDEIYPEWWKNKGENKNE